jgi:putative phosphoesterase
MKIGVMSDTHDQLSNLTYVLHTFRERGIETVIHCGDLTSLEMVSHFQGFRLIYPFGNMVFATGAIQSRLQRQREDNFAGLVFRGSLGSVPVAATHGHLEGRVMLLVKERRYQWVFHGHTHQKRDETIQGVRIVNPGALGGLGRESRSFCVVDLETGTVEFLKVE